MSDKITCPNCGHGFDVEEALSGKLEAHFKAEYEKKVAEQAEKFNLQRDTLAKEIEAFEDKKERQNELFKEKLSQGLAKEAEKIKKSTRENFEQQLVALQEENQKKTAENRNLKAQEIDLLKRENQLKEKAEELKINVEKEMLIRQKDIEEKAKAKERESFELEKIKLLKQIDDNKKLAEEMKRKAEQGSMQMQGEVQELALEELLRSAYPFDEIKEVPKGIRGADSIQIVKNKSQQICGSIVYESKRAKNFSNEWIEKLKQDQIQCKADIAVIVTETFPNDMDRFGERNGVWICGFHEVKSLSLVLRQTLIKMQVIRSSEENKGDKMELLYNYLTSNEFIQNMERVIENYDTMLEQLNSEKRAMQRIWKMREKQIGVVQQNVDAMFGSIKGIGGNMIGSSTKLELPGADLDLETE